VGDGTLDAGLGCLLTLPPGFAAGRVGGERFVASTAGSLGARARRRPSALVLETALAGKCLYIAGSRSCWIEAVAPARLLRLAVLSAAVVLCLATAPAASARAGYDMRVTNRTSEPVSVRATSEQCWDVQDLGGGGKTVPPGQTVSVISEEYTFLNFCGVRDRWVNLQLWFGDGSSAYTPLMPPGTPEWSFAHDGLYYPRLKNSLRTWMPRVRPPAGPYSGQGLYCIRQSIGDMKGKNTFSPDTPVNITIYGDGTCNTSTWGTVFPNDLGPNIDYTPRLKAAPLRAHAAAGPDEAGVVFDVLSVAQAACEVLAVPRCDETTNAALWDVRSLSVQQAFVRWVDLDVGTPARESVGSSTTSVPKGAGQGTVSVNRAVQTSKQTSTATKIGGKVSVKSSFGLLKDLIGVPEVTFEVNMEKTDTITSGKTTTTTVGVTQVAVPGGTTRLEVFTDKQQPRGVFDANLEFGSDQSELVATPMFRALDMSPGTLQPCLAAGVGDVNVRNSLLNVAQQLRNQGYSPTSPGIDRNKAYVLQAGERLSVSGRCPGFPETPRFASRAAFNGTGTLLGDKRGVDFVACVYFQPDEPQDRTPPVSENCRKVNPTDSSADGRAQGAQHVGRGTLVDGKRAPAGRVLSGTRGSDMVLADDSPDHDTLLGHGGGFDVLRGSGARELIDGGAGDDLVEAAGGDDTLLGGGGDDTLKGGPGADRIETRSGRDYLAGGSGADILRAAGSGRASLYGEPGNDLLEAAGAGRVGLAGGPGRDRYRVGANSARVTIVEFPREGRDVLSTARSLNVPINIEEARVSTPKGARLQATDGAQRLVGGPGPDELSGGRGPDSLAGGAGGDRLTLSTGDFDTVRGGPGPDRFVIGDLPQTGTPLAGVSGPVSPTAHRIRDLRPKQGDLLVLPRSSYGAEIARAGVQTTRAAAPRARRRGPTLLWDSRRSLLRFDRDGSGPLASQVVAILEGHRRLPLRALRLG
jgi:RTX calcium-binding nonapeptide repeat (4 copies)